MSKIISLVVYFLLIVVNILANALPLNNVTTGQISSIYPTLITPASYAFLIWIVIYILLGLFTLYQLKVNENTALNTKQLNELRYYFCFSSLGNILWIFAWHYNMIEVSVFIMALIFYCLISILFLLNRINLTKTDKFFIKLPFALYFGWILMAAIINITVYLVSIEWDGFGISKEVWAIAVLLLGAMITVLTMIKFNSYSLGLAVIWAYVAILFKHYSKNGYDKMYPIIMIVLLVCIVILGITEIFLIKKNKQ